jgi:hypothetical protein
LAGYYKWFIVEVHFEVIVHSGNIFFGQSWHRGSPACCNNTTIAALVAGILPNTTDICSFKKI